MTWTTVFMDGADFYATADLSAKYDLIGASVTVDSTIFRNSGKSIKGAAASASLINKYIGAGRNFVIGFGLYLSAAPGAATITSSSGALMAVSDALSATTSGQVGLALLNDGLIRAVRGPLASSNSWGSGTVELGVATTALTTSTWYYIELRGFVDNTGGQVELRINGVVQFSLTSQDTQQQSFNNFHYASIYLPVNATYVDDIYIRTNNDSAAETGGFFGDVKIKPYYPNGDGTYSAMTPSTGTTHYTLVDETSPTTTDYVSSNTALQKDSYAFQDVSETGSIKSVQLNVYAAKDDAGFRGLDLFVKSGATEDFAASQSLSTTPLFRLKGWDKDPNTAADWSQSNLNAAEFGQRISADI